VEGLLFPVDEDTARPSRRDADTALRLATEPLERTLIVLEVVLERIEARAIMVAYPLFLLFAEHVLEHHARLDRHARQTLEAEPALLWVYVLRAHVTHDEDGFDADAKFVRLVCLREKCQESVVKERGWIWTYSSQARS
jgi:hypothetical protein